MPNSQEINTSQYKRRIVYVNSGNERFFKPGGNRFKAVLPLNVAGDEAPSFHIKSPFSRVFKLNWKMKVLNNRNE